MNELLNYDSPEIASLRQAYIFDLDENCFVTLVNGICRAEYDHLLKVLAETPDSELILTDAELDIALHNIAGSPAAYVRRERATAKVGAKAQLIKVSTHYAARQEQAVKEAVGEKLAEIEDGLSLMGNPPGTPEYYMISKDDWEALKGQGK